MNEETAKAWAHLIGANAYEDDGEWKVAHEDSASFDDDVEMLGALTAQYDCMLITCREGQEFAETKEKLATVSAERDALIHKFNNRGLEIEKLTEKKLDLEFFLKNSQKEVKDLKTWRSPETIPSDEEVLILYNEKHPYSQNEIDVGIVNGDTVNFGEDACPSVDIILGWLPLPEAHL